MSSSSDLELSKGEQTLSPGEAFDKFLNHVGGTGKWQWKIFFTTSFCGIFTAFHNLAAALLAASPDHVCVIPELQKLNISLDLPNITRPDSAPQSQCMYYNRNYSQLLEQGILDDLKNITDLPEAELVHCTQWRYDQSIYTSTVVSEWDLVCDHKWLMSTCQSTFMAGVLIGALVLSELSDKFGRKTIVVISAVGFLISSIATAFSNSLALFIVLRFFTAAFGSGLFLPNFVLLMEVVGMEYRTKMGMMYQAFFSVGFMLFPFIGYFIRDWRTLELAISIPSVVMLGYYWMPESPRWLMMQGRTDDALKILSNMAKQNGKTMPAKGEVEFLVQKMKYKVIRNTNDVNCEGSGVLEKSVTVLDEEHEKPVGVFKKFLQFFSSQVILMRTPNMRRRCLIIFFSWFVVSMIYYGLTFSGGNIDASVYLMLFLGGVVEIPSYILAVWTLKLFGRRLNLSVMFFICGAACLLILAVPKEVTWANILLANIGKFFNSAAFSVAYIYSAELVPTPVRNIAVGTSSMWARIGSALAPYIVDLLGDVHYAVPSTVFGVLSLSAGALALLLPETGKTKLPETIKEVEDLPR